MLNYGAKCRFSLIALLLVVCYLADWTDDNYSYWLSTRSRTFHSANGPSMPLSGGGLDTTRLFMRGGQWKLSGETAAQNAGTQTARSSVIESVFGSPLGATSSTDDATSSSANRALSATGNRMGMDGFGRPGGSFGQSGGLGGSTYGGQAGDMSFGPAGLAGMSIPH